MPDNADYIVAPTGEPNMRFKGQQLAHCEGRYCDANHRFKNEQVNIYLTKGGRYVAERIMDRGSDLEVVVGDFGDKNEIPAFLGHSDAAKKAYEEIGVDAVRYIE